MNLKPRTLLFEALNILVYHPWGQAEFRDTPDHRSPGSIGHFVDIHPEPSHTQIVGCRQPGRTRTDDTDCLLSGYDNWRGLVIRPQLIHDVALEITNLYRPVAALPSTSRFAGRVTDPATDRTEGISRRYRFEGVFILFFPDISNVGRRVRANRAGNLTRRGYKMMIGGIVAET